MILLGPEMAHQMYWVVLDSQVAEVAALVGIRSMALAAITSFDIVDGNSDQSMGRGKATRDRLGCEFRSANIIPRFLKLVATIFPSVTFCHSRNTRTIGVKVGGDTLTSQTVGLRFCVVEG